MSMKLPHGAMLIVTWLFLSATFSGCENSTKPSSNKAKVTVNQSSAAMMEEDQPEENGTCSECNGAGTVQGCNVCRNEGWQRCNRCSGSGDDGKGTIGCEKCYSEGKIPCNNCQGAGSNYVGKCIRCNGGGKTTFKECNNCESGTATPKVQVLGVCILCEGRGRVEIPAS